MDKRFFCYCNGRITLFVIRALQSHLPDIMPFAYFSFLYGVAELLVIDPGRNQQELVPYKCASN